MRFWSQMTTDAAFGYSSDRQLKLQSSAAPSYQFIFGYRSTNTSEGIWEGTEWAGNSFDLFTLHVYHISLLFHDIKM